MSQQGRRFGADVKPPCMTIVFYESGRLTHFFHLDSYIALITLAIESSKDGKMTLNGTIIFPPQILSVYFVFPSHNRDL